MGVDVGVLSKPLFVLPSNAIQCENLSAPEFKLSSSTLADWMGLLISRGLSVHPSKSLSKCLKRINC
jgi:hypothetical protein